MSQNPFNQYGPDYMSSLNNSYRDAEIRQRGSIVDIPDGKYQANISLFTLKPSTKFEDELVLTLGFEIMDGPNKGNTAYKNYAIVPEYIATLKNDLNTLGVDLRGDIKTLGEPNTARGIIDTIVDITIKHKRANNGRNYMNVFINRVVGKSEENFKEVEDEKLPWEM